MRSNCAGTNKQLAGAHGEERREIGVAYLILNAGVALRASGDLLDDPMSFVARPLIRPQWFAIAFAPRCM